MEEIKTIGEEQKEVKEDTISLLDRTLAAVERLEKANKESQELLKRQEEIISRQILGGKSEGGVAPKVITEEDRIKEDANQYMRAVGFSIK